MCGGGGGGDSLNIKRHVSLSYEMYVTVGICMPSLHNELHICCPIREARNTDFQGYIHIPLV